MPRRRLQEHEMTEKQKEARARNERSWARIRGNSFRPAGTRIRLPGTSNPPQCVYLVWIDGVAFHSKPAPINRVLHRVNSLLTQLGKQGLLTSERQMEERAKAHLYIQSVALHQYCAEDESIEYAGDPRIHLLAFLPEDQRVALPMPIRSKPHHKSYEYHKQWRAKRKLSGQD